MSINSAWSKAQKKDYERLRLKQCRVKFDMHVYEIKAVSRALDADWSKEDIVDTARKFTIKDYISIANGTTVTFEFRDEIMKFDADPKYEQSDDDDIVITIDI